MTLAPALYRSLVLLALVAFTFGTAAFSCGGAAPPGLVIDSPASGTFSTASSALVTGRVTNVAASQADVRVNGTSVTVQPDLMLAAPPGVAGEFVVEAGYESLVILISPAMTTALLDQLNEEFYSAYLYLAMSAYSSHIEFSGAGDAAAWDLCDGGD